MIGVVLVNVVPAPRRATGPESVRGHRVLPVVRGAVRELTLTLGGRDVRARRSSGGGWEIDGRLADASTAERVEDLVEILAHMRAIDVFRPRDVGGYGLEPPRGTITVATDRRTRRLTLGSLNAAGSALYVRRDRDRRVMQVGSLLLSRLELVFHALDPRRDRPATGARIAQEPEIG